MNSTDNKAKDLNIINYIYDEEFINLINSLSSAIKDYFKDFKQVITTFKTQTESINEQTLCAKSDINDVLLYLTQTRAKTTPSASEKFIREKGLVVSEKIGKINEVKGTLTQLIKTSEINFLSFYDKAKDIFKLMKTSRSHKIDEINAKINFDKYSDKHQKEGITSGNITNTHNMSNSKQKNMKQSTTSSIGQQPQPQSSLDSSQHKFNTCNTVGNTINVKNVNYLSQSSEDYIKKNENLLSEITLMNIRYSEVFKENQTLKNMIAKMKANPKIIKDNNIQSLQSSTNSYNNTINTNNSDTNNRTKSIMTNIKDAFYDINSAKSKSLPKNNNKNNLSTNNYIVCNTTENEDNNNNKSRKCNPLLNSITIKKKPSSSISKQMMPAHNVKRTFSIDNNNKKINNPRSNEAISGSSNSQMKSNSNNTTIGSSHIPFRSDMTINPFLSNSNSMTNTICINNNNTTPNCNSLNASFSTQSNVAHLVLGFISQMKLLQESISTHSDNVKEMKRTFELKKKELIKISEGILGINTVIGNSSGIGTGTGTGINTATGLSGNYSQEANSTLTAINSLTPTPRSLLKKTPPAQTQAQSQLQSQSKVHIETIAKLESELSQLKTTNQELEKKVKNEKSINTIYEEKLNEEKTMNKELNDTITKLKEQLSEHDHITNANKLSLDSLEKSNKALMQIVSEQKHTISQIETDLTNRKTANEQLEQDKADQLRKINLLSIENEKYEEECSNYKTEIGRLKTSITECNQNIITISNTNESIISEKDQIIKKHSETIGEKRKEVSDLTVQSRSLRQKIEELEKKLEENRSISIKEMDMSYNANATAKTNTSNDEVVKGLNDKIAQYEKDLLNYKHENRELMNKISQIKNEYLNYNEEKKEIELKLIQTNEKVNINLLDIKVQLDKQRSKEANSAVNTNTNTSPNNNINSNANDNSLKIQYLKQQITLLNKTLENKINEIVTKDSLIQQLQGLKIELAKTQEENEKLKQIIYITHGKDSVSNRNNPNKTLSNINEQNSNFIDDDLYNVSGIFLEEKKEGGGKETQ